MASPLWIALVLYAAIHQASPCAGQGFKESGRTVVGSSSSYTQLQKLYSNSRTWRAGYKLNPASACSKSGSNSLCAQTAANTADALDQLMLAASPMEYSSSNPRDARGVRLVAAPLDQGPCDTCAALAVASAAETAIASVQRVDVADCSISPQALHFCPPPGTPVRSCRGGWNILDTFRVLQQYSQIPTLACMPYKPDQRNFPDRSELCSSPCTAPNQYLSQGRFEIVDITNIWQAQEFIRRYGSVVSRFDVYPDFPEFFQNFANAQAVYKPKPEGNAEFVRHAVVLVGYNNDKQYWMVKNSWGPNRGDNGFFKVAFGTCSVLTSDAGEAYGIRWVPTSKETPPAAKLNLAPGPRPDCYWYKAVSGDYMSRIAIAAGIPLETFMMANVQYVKDLDAPLDGLNLLVCNPRTGSFTVSSKPTQPAASPSSASDPQLEALLRIKAAIDTKNSLKAWSRELGANRQYCNWPGVRCDGSYYVEGISLTLELGTGLVGTLPPAAAFTGLTKISVIEISRDEKPTAGAISGTLPSDWSQLQGLTEVEVGRTRVSGTIPAAWGSLIRLTRLEFWVNNLQGRVPDTFKSLTSLKYLALDHNQLTGSIPPWLGSLTNLEFLSLVGNRFSGQLAMAHALKSLTKLQGLHVPSNVLTGTIPPWLGSLVKLERLTFGDNQLSGQLPASLGNLSKLYMLYCDGNSLKGQLPDSFKGLVALRFLNVSRNSFEGTIPSSWASMSSLEQVWVHTNPHLKGCLPKAWSGKVQDGLSGTQIKGFC